MPITNSYRHVKRLSHVSLCCLLLAACGDASVEDDDALVDDGTPRAPVETLYNDAQDALKARNYKRAVKTFEEVESQYPYSEWAMRAQVMAAYAHYRNGDYDDAIALLGRFVKLHPSNKNTPYAFYLIALSYYDQISDVGRDQKMTQLALQALNDVIQRFPQSDYARDARIKLDLVYDHLAGKEMEIGRYYLHQHEYIAAVNRFKYVIDHYQTTSHVPEALHRLTENYLKLGVKDEAKRYAAVLGHNFPGSDWYQDAYALLVDSGNLPAGRSDEKWWSGWFTE